MTPDTMRSGRFRLVACTGLAALLAHTPAAVASDSPIEGQLQRNSATPPQQAVGEVIEDICPPGNLLSADLQARCNEIAVGGAALFGAGDVPGAQDGLQAMAPEENASVGTSSVDARSVQVEGVGARLAALRGGARGFSAQGLSLYLDGRRLEGDEVLTALAGEERGRGASADEFGRWGLFVNGHAGFGDRDGTARESGFDFDSLGITAGVDYRVSDTFFVGVAGTFTSADADVDNAGGELDSDSYGVSGYATVQLSEAWYADAVIGAGLSDHDQDRAVRYSIAALGGGTTNVNQIASADFDGDYFNASLSSGYNFYRDGWTFGPYARLQRSSVDVDGFTERMSNPAAPGSGLALQIDDQEFDSFTVAVGGQASRAISTSWGVLLPNASFEFIHEFDNDAEDITGRFVDDITRTTFVLGTDDPDRNYYVVGLGVSAVFARGRSAFVSYQGLIGYEDLENHAITAGLRMEF